MYEEGRTAAFMWRMTPTEKAALKDKARRSGLTQTAFVRKAVWNQEVKEIPPIANQEQLRIVRAIGNNINQVVHRANAYGALYRQDIEEIKELQRELLEIAREGANYPQNLAL